MPAMEFGLGHVSQFEGQSKEQETGALFDGG